MSSSLKNRSSLLGMNLEYQLNVLKSLNFMDLLDIAQTNEKILELAIGVFQQNFGHKSLKIQASSYPKRFKLKVANDIIVTDIEIALKILSIFGSKIRVLKIRYERIEYSDAKKLTQHINQFCSQSLTHLGISGITKKLWSFMGKPFVNVEDVAFSKVLEPMKKMKMNQIFPQLRTLILINTEIKDPAILNCTFPHMNHLFVSVLTPEVAFAEETEHFLSSNPQIRHLTVQHNFQHFLEEVHHKLQTIETLELLWPQDDYSNGKPTHFENVKQLIVTSNSFPVPTKVTFAQLEEIECYCYPELSDEYIDYFKMNRNVRKINITSEVKNEQFERLSGSFPNLMEASVKCGDDVRDDSVAEFIERNCQINKLLLLTANQTLHSSLRTRLHVDWKLHSFHNGTDYYGIQLERHPKCERPSYIPIICGGFVVFLVLLVIVIVKREKFKL